MQSVARCARAQLATLWAHNRSARVASDASITSMQRFRFDVVLGICCFLVWDRPWGTALIISVCFRGCPRVTPDSERKRS
jgi:hypothetical protein